MGLDIIIPEQEIVEQMIDKSIYQIPLQTELNTTEYCIWYMQNYFNITQVLLILCTIIILVYCVLVFIHMKYGIKPNQAIKKIRENLMNEKQEKNP